MKTKLKSILFGASMVAASGMAHATDLSFAGGWPPNSSPTKMLERYAEAVNEYSGGDLNVRVFPLSLLSFGEINEGLRDGIADVAVNLFAYFPAEFPQMNMLAEYSQLVELDQFSGEKSSLAYAGAMSEYIMLNCPACQKEMDAQNQVYLGALATTGYVLQCVTPLETAEDLKGKRIRAAGAFWSRWAEAMGAVPVSMSINETLEALNQGVLDCTASNTADFVNFGFIDVVKYVYTGLPGAVFIAPAAMNKDVWNDMSAENKAALLKGHAKLAADVSWIYLEEGRAGKERAPSEGIEYGKASDDLLKANQGFISADKDAVAGIYKDRFGIEGGAEAAAVLAELLGKWTDLVAGVDSDAELAELYWNEVFSKIDTASYGQ